MFPTSVKSVYILSPTILEDLNEHSCEQGPGSTCWSVVLLGNTKEPDLCCDMNSSLTPPTHPYLQLIFVLLFYDFNVTHIFQPEDNPFLAWYEPQTAP